MIEWLIRERNAVFLFQVKWYEVMTRLGHIVKSIVYHQLQVSFGKKIDLKTWKPKKK